MKYLIFITIALIMFSACTEQSAPYNTDVTVLIDQTDSLTSFPTAHDLLAPFALNTNVWQSIKITLVAISDKDINKTLVVTLEPGNKLSDNIMLRRAIITRFTAQLQNSLAQFTVAQALPRSIIFRTIATQATALHNSTAPHKLLLVYSDLLEHSDVDFYKEETRTALQKSPALIEQQLSLQAPLPMLNGITVWFLYTPTNYHTNNVYMPIAHFYEHIYKAHRAEVHIAQQFMPQ